jgi:hypothetical protein
MCFSPRRRTYRRRASLSSPDRHKGLTSSQLLHAAVGISRASLSSCRGRHRLAPPVFGFSSLFVLRGRPVKLRAFFRPRRPSRQKPVLLRLSSAADCTTARPSNRPPLQLSSRPRWTPTRPRSRRACFCLYAADRVAAGSSLRLTLGLSDGLPKRPGGTPAPRCRTSSRTRYVP